MDKLFKVSAAWGHTRYFSDIGDAWQHIEEEELMSGMFPARIYVLCADGQYRELANDC